MKELIKKILREEVKKRFTKSSPSFERLIIKQMEDLLSETNRVVVPPDDNYGNYGEEWCRGDKIIVEARYHIDDDNDKFFAGDLYIDKEEIDFLSQMLPVRKSFIFNVITEWYDEKYATKFGQETGHPEFEIEETNETDARRKCYQNVDTDNLSREEMIDYLDKHTAHNTSLVKRMSDDELKRTYRRVYNIQLNN